MRILSIILKCATTLTIIVRHFNTESSVENVVIIYFEIFLKTT